MHTQPLHTPVAIITLVASIMAAALALFAGTATADTPAFGPELELAVPGPTPEPTPPPWEIEDLQVIPTALLPTAEAELNCGSGTLDIHIGNKTLNHWFIEVWADGVVVGGGPVAPNHAQFEQIALAENESTHVIVSAISESPLIDETYTMDCLVPQPEYDVVASCATGQAWARLINHGDDTASMGVQYPDVMHMEIDVAPHSSVDWLLAVSPGETVDFEIMASNVGIGAETLAFTCETPAPPAVPTPDAVGEASGQSGSGEPTQPTVEPGSEEQTEVGNAGVVEAGDATTDTPAEAAGAATTDAPTETGDGELASGPVVTVGAKGSNTGLFAGLGLLLVGLTLLAGAGVALRRGRADR